MEVRHKTPFPSQQKKRSRRRDIATAIGTLFPWVYIRTRHAPQVLPEFGIARPRAIMIPSMRQCTGCSSVSAQVVGSTSVNISISTTAHCLRKSGRIKANRYVAACLTILLSIDVICSAKRDGHKYSSRKNGAGMLAFAFISDAMRDESRQSVSSKWPRHRVRPTKIRSPRLKFAKTLTVENRCLSVSFARAL